MQPTFIDLLLPLAPFIFFAGVVDAIAGGGGLIAVPAYLAVGLNPALILGTNKLSSSIGTTVSTINYLRRIKLDIKIFLPIVIVTLISASLGAHAISQLDPNIIRWLLIVALPLVALLLLKFKDFGAVDSSATLSKKAIKVRGSLLASAIGCYDGFFGPGTGTFFVLGFTQWLRFDLLRAAAYGRYLNFASNLAALATFFWADKVYWQLGLALGLFGMAGHYLGSKLAIKGGHRVIRPVLMVVLLLLLSKVIFDTFSA